MESIVQEIANVGITILCVVVGIVIVRWLDRNVFDTHRRTKHGDSRKGSFYEISNRKDD